MGGFAAWPFHPGAKPVGWELTMVFAESMSFSAASGISVRGWCRLPLDLGLLIVPLRQFPTHVSLGHDSGCQRHADFPVAGSLWIVNGLESGACASPSICANGYAAVWGATAGSPTARPGHGNNADLTSAG
jgi:hypothetical protein